MSQTGPPASTHDAGEGRGLGRIFTFIVLVEIVTLAALYVFGRHFTQP